MILTLLHTADVHVASFDNLRDRIAPGTALTHIVRREWLEDARVNGVRPELEQKIGKVVQAASGVVICTCTTLGDAAEAYGATRIDRPMMRKAASGGAVLMAYALESTREPSRELFLAEGGREADLHMTDLTGLWPLFEAGRVGAFHRAIADAIRADLVGTDKIVLAQASMAGAATYLTDLEIPVLTSPELALRDALGLDDGV